MEPITHLLTGACLAQAGFNRKAAYATVAMTLAAELPDLDMVWGVAGPVAAFQHHRGWTHSFVGMPVQAAAMVGAIWLWHRWRLKRNATIKTAAPVRWGWLFLFTLLAVGSHLLLDYTNNYGLRPFFPFNTRWYAGSIVFIFEPVIFLLLLGALVAPLLFGLIGSEVGARPTPFRGRGWAIAALAGVVTLWGWRSIEKEKALRLVAAGDFSGAGMGTEDAEAGRVQVVRVGVSPHPITPFQWNVIVETPMYYQLASVDTLSGAVTTAKEDLFYKPPTTIATLVAKRSWLGEVYLDWSQYPLVQEAARSTDPEDAGLTTVTFRDLRFLYDVPLMKGRTNPPLSGTVTMNNDRKVVGMEMDGWKQR
jgi:inner membrane protein